MTPDQSEASKRLVTFMLLGRLLEDFGTVPAASEDDCCGGGCPGCPGGAE